VYFDCIIAGFGGQGVMFIGNLLAEAAMGDGHKTTYMPVYGVEMRGGTANCTVVVSDDEIGSPIIHYPLSAVVMNKPSLVKFGPRVKKDGLLLVNASLIEKKDVKVKGLEVLMVPAIDLAKEAGNDRLANMVILGALVEKSGVTDIDALAETMKESLPERAQKMAPVNRAALERGADFARNGG
jgi:2-oxoglutarate ferredoxin oxidoreductase subunit gamma